MGIMLQNPFQKPALYQNTTSQAAEKLEIESALYQGTTSVVPEKAINNAGFSP
jgi:hypothetical protein